VAAAGEVLARAEATWVALDVARLGELPDGANAVFANEQAALRLDGDDPELAVRTLGEWYRLACVTLGPRGALATLDGRIETVEPEAVLDDAPGSGDAFAATLLVGIAAGDDLADALARAARAALDSLA
jgi:sugar/nucleoside kinase (ribokinase family)